MSLPLPDAYRSAIQNPDVAFKGNPELAQTTPETNRHGIPSTYSGSFTATFHLLGGTNEWAIRCYTREILRVIERYDAITRFLQGRPDPALAMARLVPRGIVVGGNRYDIIQMEWITGSLLNTHVDSLIEDGDTSSLAQLAEHVVALSRRLEHLEVAHGDIQHGNVLIDKLGNLRLIDYDDMFLPSLAHLRMSSGIGQDNYQHPGRGTQHYDGKLDRFPFISIYVSLRALIANPTFRNEGDEDCLLFRKKDFLNPSGSVLFQQLDSTQGIKEIVNRFASICAGAYDDIPTLTEFITMTQAATPKRSTSVMDLIPDATPFLDRPVGLSPLLSTTRQSPRWPGLPITILGAASVLVIVVALLLLVGHRSAQPIASSLHVAAPGQRSHLVDRAPARSGASHRQASQVISASHTKPVLEATSTAAPKPAATTAPATAANSDEATKSVPTAAVAPKKAAKIEPTTAAAPKSVPAMSAAPNVIPQAMPAGASVVAPAPRSTCSTPDAPAHVVSLAVPQLSDEKRMASAGKSVTVSVDVAADGTVMGASVRDSAGDVALDFAALGVARHSTYAAAEENCTTAAGTVDVTVTY